MKKIVLIGSGNVATHLGSALWASGVQVLQVWSRSIENATVLAQKMGSQPISLMSDISAEADAYIFSVKDDALSKVLSQFPYTNKLLIHTVGSISVDVLEPYSSRYGVLYPLQTFSKVKNVDFKNIPLLLEASDDRVMQELRVLAEGISLRVALASSIQRKSLHIAAVFACNFTNHLYAIAEDVLSNNALDFDLIRPLILETAEKAMLHSPKEVQTGPAVRKDAAIVNSHLAMLEDYPDLQLLYQLLSERIMNV